MTRTWPGTRSPERAIKDQHNAPHLCPDCTPQPRLDANGRPVRAARREGRAEPAPHRQMAGSWAQAPVHESIGIDAPYDPGLTAALKELTGGSELFGIPLSKVIEPTF